MPAHPRRSYLHHGVAVMTALTLSATAAPVVAAPAATAGAASMSMPMGDSTPEHVAGALAALNRGDLSHARADLRLAAKSHTEPMDARMHAKEALASLKVGDRAMAKMHATSGAAVEHLTYALQALRAGETNTTRGHLTEAAAIPKVRAQAKAALAALKRGDRKTAIRDINVGLKAANRE